VLVCAVVTAPDAHKPPRHRSFALDALRDIYFDSDFGGFGFDDLRRSLIQVVRRCRRKTLLLADNGPGVYWTVA
jgi:hypothetical protein